MCGIAGFFYARPIAAEKRQQALEQLKNRGPDRQNILAWNNGKEVQPNDAANAALIHTRLAIQDLSESADQPMFNAQKNVFLLFNGEIYDWANQKKNLENQGWTFKTHSDTEFILNAYLAHGFPKMLSYLRGMFAFALVDFRCQKVFLARDRLGLKPLIYGQNEKGLVFSSTVRGALALIEEKNISTQAIDAFLTHRYIPAPLTIFKELKRLPNAHWVVFDLHEKKLSAPQCYWRLPFFEKNHAVTVESALEELRNAVKMRLVAERPLGLFLSSGIDSSAMACVLNQLGQPIQTFTATFDHPDFDESQLAENIAQTLSLPNQKIHIPSSIQADFEQIVADLDEPFADPSSFPTWFLAKQTAQYVKVVLGGDGGDELFAGYKRYAHHLRRRFRPSLPFLPKWASLNKKAKWLDEWRMSWEKAYVLRFSGFSPNERRFLTARTQLPDHYWRLPDALPQNALERLLSIDFANTLPEYILRKADYCTMAHGLEMRAPLLDHVFVEKISALPYAVRFTQPPKTLLSPLFQPLQPLHLFAQKKRGFNPPLKNWLLNDFQERGANLGENLERLSNGFLCKNAVQTFYQRFQQGEFFRAERILQLFILQASLTQLQQ